MFKFKFLNLLMLLLGLISFIAAGFVFAQDDAPPANKAQDEAKAQAAEGRKLLTGSTIIQLDGGKLIVVDQDGKEREIDVGNAKSVIVQRSAKSQMVDGEGVVTKVTGKAIVVGPDGAVEEIEIEGPGEGQLEMPGFKMDLDIPQEMLRMMQVLPGQLRDFPQRNLQSPLGAQGAMGKYFIGIQCEPVNEALRSHLGLDAGLGLTINEVTPESPAEKAGLKKHDILLYAGEKPLSEVAELVSVINDAGEEGLIVELRIIRAGKESSVQVTPEERRVQDEIFEAIPAREFMKLEFKEGEPGVFRVLPGLIRAADDENVDANRQMILAELEKLIGNSGEIKRAISDESFREEMQRLREEMQNAHEEFRKAREEMLKSLQEMKRSIPGISERLNPPTGDGDQ